MDGNARQLQDAVAGFFYFMGMRGGAWSKRSK